MNDHISKILANMEPAELMQVLARSQQLRQVEDAKPKEVPVEVLNKLKHKYTSLSDLNQIRIPVTFSGHLVCNITLDYDTYYMEKVTLEGDFGNTNSSITKLLDQSIENYADMCGFESLLEDYNEKAIELAEEIEATAEKYGVEDLYSELNSQIDGENDHRPYGRRYMARRKRKSR